MTRLTEQRGNDRDRVPDRNPLGIAGRIAFTMNKLPLHSLKNHPPLVQRHSTFRLTCAPVIFFLFFLMQTVSLRAEEVSASYQEKDLRPFPQAGSFPREGVVPDAIPREQVNKSVRDFYYYWRAKYILPSVKVPGDYKIKYDRRGRTVSEAMGYGMMITAYMAGSDPKAKGFFDGLNSFRKRFPSKINPAFMCWQMPMDESPCRNDSATDGDLDIAFALLLAHGQWGDPRYLEEAKSLIHEIGTSLVRPDGSLKLGDWNEEEGQTRPSDFMPTHFRAFLEATGDQRWKLVETKSYAILNQLQNQFSPVAGLAPDFSIEEKGQWIPAKPKFLEGLHDGEFNYNACRVPWRIGWAASTLEDPRAKALLTPFLAWVLSHAKNPESLRSGFHLDGSDIKGNTFDSACFIAPTGVAAAALGNQAWLNGVFNYCREKKEEYFEDTVSMLCLLVMSGNAWIPLERPSKPQSSTPPGN